jgi:hypothetical protein
MPVKNKGERIDEIIEQFSVYCESFFVLLAFFFASRPHGWRHAIACQMRRLFRSFGACPCVLIGALSSTNTHTEDISSQNQRYHLSPLRPSNSYFHYITGSPVLLIFVRMCDLTCFVRLTDVLGLDAALGLRAIQQLPHPLCCLLFLPTTFRWLCKFSSRPSRAKLSRWTSSRQTRLPMSRPRSRTRKAFPLTNSA